MTHRDGLEEHVERAVLECAGQVVALSHAIHDDPETAWKEQRAASRVGEILASHGFDVTASAHGLDTAIVGEFGEEGPIIALCCEYDALPGLGHACGHNIIAAAGVGAALGLAAVSSKVPLRVRVIGTPAEESGGGKIPLLERGAFDDVAVAMMVHPYAHDVASFRSLTREGVRVRFTGRAAHSATAPHQGVNAGDAATLTHVAVGLMRQQLPPDTWIHGITRNAGSSDSIIPAGAELEFGIRALDSVSRAEVRRRFDRLVEGVCLITGCTAELDAMGRELPYEEFHAHEGLAEAYARHIGARGRTVRPGAPDASTDMGNVSARVPSLHAMIGLGGHALPHEVEFMHAARGEAGDRAVVDSAIALALTGLDVARGFVDLAAG